MLVRMEDQIDNSSEGPPEQPSPQGGGEQGPFSEQLRHDPVGARVPERVAAGVFCTGAIVLQGPGEFLIDFVQSAARPPRVGARVVMNPRVMSQFVQALKDNLQKYEQRFGPPKPMPKPSPNRRRSIPEMYEDLKMPDEQLSGTYATTVMIGHTPAEFSFDFITRFFPTAAVSARVYLSASQVPRVLETLSSSFRNYLNQAQKGPGRNPPDRQQGK